MENKDIEQEQDIEQLYYSKDDMLDAWDAMSKYEDFGKFLATKDGYKANTVNKELLEALKGLMELETVTSDNEQNPKFEELYESRYEKAKEAIQKAEKLLL